MRGAARAHRPAPRRRALKQMSPSASRGSRDARPDPVEALGIFGLGPATPQQLAGACWPPLEGLAAAPSEAPRRGARLRRHQKLDARGRRWRRARPGECRVGASTSRSGMRSFDLLDARGAQPRAERPPRRRCCCAPPQPRRPNLEREGGRRAGSCVLVGDVMVDVALRASRRARSDERGAPRAYGLQTRGAYLLLTATTRAGQRR